MVATRFSTLKTQRITFSVVIVTVMMGLVTAGDNATTTTENSSSEEIVTTTGSSVTENTSKNITEEKKDDKKRKLKSNVEIIGGYTLVSDSRAKDYEEYLKAMEYSDEDRELIRNSTHVVITIAKNDTLWTVKRSIKNRTMTLTFESGKEFEGELLDSRKRNTTIIVNEEEKRGDLFIKMNGFNVSQEVVFSVRGFKIMYKAKNATAKQVFRRIHEIPQVPNFGNIFETLKNISIAISNAFRNRKNDSSEEEGDNDSDNKGGIQTF